MKKYKIIAVVAALLISGCGRIDSGIVYGKSHVSPFIKNSSSVVGKTIIPRKVPLNEKWKLFLVRDDHSGWCAVSKLQYDISNYGDFFICP